MVSQQRPNTDSRVIQAQRAFLFGVISLFVGVLSTSKRTLVHGITEHHVMDISLSPLENQTFH